MKIRNTTKLYCSIANSPGNTGAIIQNYLNDKFNCDCIYVPLKVDKKSLSNALKGIIALGINGCAISAPLKIEAYHAINQLTMEPGWSVVPAATVKQTHVANTIIKYNDYYGLHNTDTRALYGIVGNMHKQYNCETGRLIKTAIVLGTGATARSVCCALESFVSKIYVATRNINNVNNEWFKTRLNVLYHMIPYHFVNDISTKDMFIVNATSCGMPDSSSCCAINLEKWHGFNHECVILDVVNADTALVNFGKQKGAFASNGLTMAIQQSISQFELYNLDIEISDDDRIALVYELKKLLSGEK